MVTIPAPPVNQEQGGRRRHVGDAPVHGNKNRQCGNRSSRMRKSVAGKVEMVLLGCIVMPVAAEEMPLLASQRRALGTGHANPDRFGRRTVQPPCL